MNSISSVNNSIEAVSQLLKIANKQNLELADKLLRFNVEQNIGKEAGKGEQIDISV
jgi:hypothetical protein